MAWPKGAHLVETFGFFGEGEAVPGGPESAHAALEVDPFAAQTYDPLIDGVLSFEPPAVPEFEATPAAPPALTPLSAPPEHDPSELFAPPSPLGFAPPVDPNSTFASAGGATLAMPVSAGSVGVSASAGSSGDAHSMHDNDDALAGFSLTDMLLAVLDRGASDLHLTAGARPTMRYNGSLAPMEELPVLTPPVIHQMMYQILTQKQRERFEEVLELDFAYAVPGRARFRVNIYRQRESLGAAFRLIPFEIKPLEALGVPPSVSNFAMMPRGFVLVTGPTGSGKSTTLAGIIDLANRQRREHIMTVEDPIEFLHQHKSCLINQREVGDDTHSFGNALKHVLRQDPDIILVGEMRDLETISVALTAAETGHLVFATLHTQDAAQTIDRVIDVFPPHQQQQVRVQLAGSLQGVVSQTLCKTADGRGRVVATEVLVATPAIRNLIREGKTHQIYSALQAGARHGMHTMDQHLAELVKAGRISMDTALEKCHH
ncbi:MAG: twitching motility protein PilT, partial [Actinomycetota bacterium]|nr:twitching motility protein PilT [Actinomycetota bacterium]